jgi:hypothetical protein
LTATNRWRRPAHGPAESLAGALISVLALVPSVAAGQIMLGGDVRYYQFLTVEETEQERADAELGIFRLTLAGRLRDDLSFEAQGLLSAQSPASAGVTSIAVGETPLFLPLQWTLVDDEDLRLDAGIDRLNVTWQRSAFRLVAGRQAITWGVNFFWPVLDLFAPFPPQRIDREYKPGVDAVRLILPIGSLSETEIVAAAQGENLEANGSVGALARIHLGAADVGLMVGRFHRDLVAGSFVTADVKGTGVRAEVAFTDSGDPFDAHIDRKQFCRATVGVDRQLTATVSITVEASYNGFGTDDPAQYLLLAMADRVRRGEITSLGRWYAGVALTWQAHPLVSITSPVLVNASDGSVLLLPHADWSLGDDVSLELGGIFGIGPSPRSDGAPRSEYGSAPATFYGALKVYF